MKCYRCEKEIIGRSMRTYLKFCSQSCQIKTWREKNKQKVEGYANHYHSKTYFGGVRELVLERDKYRCTKCSLTDHGHLIKYGCRLSVDHIDGNRKNNSMENLQTLCLGCHGKKDSVRGKKFYDLSKEKQGNIIKNLDYGRSVRHKYANK